MGLSEAEIEKRLAEYDAKKAKKAERIAYLQEIVSDDEIDIDTPPSLYPGGWNSQKDWNKLTDEEKIKTHRRFMDREGEFCMLIRNTEAWKVMQAERREAYKKALQESRSITFIPCQTSEMQYIPPEKPNTTEIILDSMVSVGLATFGIAVGFKLFRAVLF